MVSVSNTFDNHCQHFPRDWVSTPIKKYRPSWGWHPVLSRRQVWYPALSRLSRRLKTKTKIPTLSWQLVLIRNPKFSIFNEIL